MKKRFIGSLVVMAVSILLSQPAIADDLDELKATHERFTKAWNTGDLETVFEIYHEGYIRIPHLTAFPSFIRNMERVKKPWSKWYETLEVYRTGWYKAEYRVIGNTGLVWGLGQEVRKRKNGLERKYFLKVSHTWVKSEGKWKLVLYHATPIPSEIVTY